jgi:hypothetical protein
MPCSSKLDLQQMNVHELDYSTLQQIQAKRRFTKREAMTNKSRLTVKKLIGATTSADPAQSVVMMVRPKSAMVQVPGSAGDMYMVFLQSLWASIPSPSVNMTSQSPLQHSVRLTVANVKRYIKHPLFRTTTRKYSWEDRFNWFFPTSMSNMARGQGWKTSSYWNVYYQWSRAASRDERNKLKQLFYEEECMPGGTPKDKLWIQKSSPQGTILVFMLAERM